MGLTAIIRGLWNNLSENLVPAEIFVKNQGKTALFNGFWHKTTATGVDFVSFKLAIPQKHTTPAAENYRSGVAVMLSKPFVEPI